MVIEQMWDEFIAEEPARDRWPDDDEGWAWSDDNDEDDERADDEDDAHVW